MAHFKNPSLQIGKELHELQCALAAVLSLPVVGRMPASPISSVQAGAKPRASF